MDRVRAHQQTANKAEGLSEHKVKRASDLELEWDPENGVYSLGGRRITFACEVYEFDHEVIGESGESADSKISSQVKDSEISLS